MAYKLALQHEERHNFRYDWIVHARPDGAWLSPTEPISHFSPLRVWVPATWQEYCPDTFALVPRAYADPFFLMSFKVIPDREKSVFCLGGPDFNYDFCNATYLRDKLRFDEAHVSNITNMCCTVEPLAHSESIQKAVLWHNQLWTEPAPFHYFIARAHEPGGFCGPSLEPAFVWKLLNYKQQIVEKNLSYWTRSVGPLVGCHSWSTRCKVKTENVQTETPQGIFSLKTVTDFNCPAMEDGFYNFRKSKGNLTHVSFSFF